VKSFFNYCKEKNVLDLIDDITLDTVGTVKSMADSGNSAYNVLDARDVKINNNEVEFTTTEKNIKVTKPIIDSIVIHIGSGVNEDRPVVEFDIKFKNKTYNKIKFSLADRSKNETPVLLGREFLTKLDALIDVNG